MSNSYKYLPLKYTLILFASKKLNINSVSTESSDFSWLANLDSTNSLFDLFILAEEVKEKI